MAISAVDAYSQALIAQQYGMNFQTFGGGAIGGTTTQGKPESVNEAGTKVNLSAGFNWHSLNKLDGNLTGTASATSIGRTSEVSPESIFSIGTGAQAAGKPTAYNAQSELMATLNGIDAKDIGLNSNKNGFDGQRHINYLA